MVEYTTNKSIAELSAFGHKNLGVYKRDSIELKDIIMKATVKNKYDLILLRLTGLDNTSEEICNVFVKKGEI